MSSLKTSILYIETKIKTDYSTVVGERVYSMNTAAGFYVFKSRKLPAVGIVYTGGTPDKSKPSPQYWKRPFDIYVYQSIWKGDISIMGSGDAKGVVEMIDELEAILNGAADPANGIADVRVVGDIPPGILPNFESKGYSAFAGLKLLLIEE